MLSHEELVVLGEVVERALASGRRIVDPIAAEAGCLERGVGHDQWFSAVAALGARGLIASQTATPSQVVLLAATNQGILRHLDWSDFDLDGARERLVSALRAAELNRPLPLADVIGQPPLLVECLLDEWVTQRRVRYSPAPGRRFRIHWVDLASGG
ncbi:MAG: hypothetical protein M3314_15845 [Actinomycetota bacterium]|nr:hypothetical protein [Actinomycetota bacterium]